MSDEYDPDDGYDPPGNRTEEPFPSILASSEDERRKRASQDARRFVLIDSPQSLPYQQLKTFTAGLNDLTTAEFIEHVKAICFIDTHVSICPVRNCNCDED